MTDELFSNNDIEQFTEDDNEAGRNIGKMLALFFLYTIIAMILVGSWTYMSLS